MCEKDGLEFKPVETGQAYCQRRKLETKIGRSGQVCEDGPGGLFKLKEKEKVNKLKGGLGKVGREDEPGRMGGGRPGRRESLIDLKGPPCPCIN